MNIEVVTASKKPQKIREVPATVRVITAGQIKENGYLTLEEALSPLPGFQFRNIFGLNSYVFERGVPSQNNLILILVDGIQINELNSGGFYGGGQYNLDNVERIEVVYGPASALYGTNAISGIVNLITKNPKGNEGLNINALYGSFNTLNTNIGYGFYDEKKDLGFRVSGMLKKSDKADLTEEKGDNNWTENLETFENDYSFDAKLTYKDFTAGLIFQNKQVSAGTYYRSVGTIYRDKGTLWNIRFINGYLKHNYKKSEKLSLLSQLYYRNATVLDNSVHAVVDTARIGYYRPNDLIGFESMVNYTPNHKLTLISGIVFERENLAEGYSKTWSNSPEENPARPAKPDMKSNTLLSVYGQAQYFLLKSLQLTTGARFDNSSVYNQVLTPRAGLVYNKDRLTAKLLYMEAFRAPRPWDYTWGTGNPDLKPENMNTVEVFLGYNLYSNLRTEASIYKNTITDILIKDAGRSKWVNSGSLKTDGFELGLSYYTEKLSPYINYTYNDSRYKDGGEVPEISKHSANIGVKVALTRGYKFNFSGNYLGSRKNPHIIPATGKDLIDPAFVLNSVLTCSSFHNLNIQLIVKNVLDAKYYHTSNRSDPAYLVSRFRQPQRTIMLRIGYKIQAF
ncbi:TonB-dependent receptor [bacterium]|nr:TonB-dependent receptor [bacterium]